MRFRLTLLVFAALFACATARGDQIVLKDGTAYSGTFIRGNSSTIEFRILNRTETFDIGDVDQINFTATAPPSVPAVGSAPAAAATSAVAAASSSAASSSAASAASAAASAASAASATGASASRTARTPGRAGGGARPELTRKPAPSDADARPESTSLPDSETVTLPKGTLITVRTTQSIDTERNRVGDAFTATLEEDLNYGDRTVAPRGCTVTGRIAYAEESGSFSGQSQLILELTKLTVDGASYTLRTSDYTEVGSSRGSRTVATVGGTAAIGAIIGAIAGGGRGAAIGAASGAAVGTGVQAATKGQVLKVPAETLLEFRLESPLVIDVYR
ncbi:MAG: hypothetical protein LBT74_08665 [Acidobacteriota bacterium]|jgi:hypothetical protein|nr:hypothetical protein [Acidobacteriota bacterium]